MAAKKAKNPATIKESCPNIENGSLPPTTKDKLNFQTTATNSTFVQPSPNIYRLIKAKLQTRSCWLFLSQLKSCDKTDTVLEYVKKADYSFYRREDYYSYRKKEVKKIKKYAR